MDTGQRPWGHYVILEDAETHKVKRIVVKPHQKISLQKHQKRSETWIVVSGRGNVHVNGNDWEVASGNIVKVPVSFMHRIENIDDKADLVFIEVQTGTYFGEDDIERFEDIYGRK
jgi:mannose-6-phosphate isomerase